MSTTINPDGYSWSLDSGQQLMFKHLDVETNEMVDGTTSDELLFILYDRTLALDEKFPCDENKITIKALQIAIHATDMRMTDRINRGVIGKHEK